MDAASQSDDESGATAEFDRRKEFLTNWDSVCHDPVAFLRLLHPPGSVYEIRIPHCPEKPGKVQWPKTAAGYFQSGSASLKAQIGWAESVQPPGIYVSLNPCQPELFARNADWIKHGVNFATADSDITMRRWLFIDIDSIRKSGISATDGEVEAALALGQEIKEALAAEGWPDPLLGMSGNGCYLIYRIELPNDEVSTELLKKLLKELAHRFDNDLAHVDTSTFNASRIIKILGTTARKGSDLRGIAGIPDRPHRQSWFVPPSSPLEVVPAELLEALVANVKPTEKSPWSPPETSTSQSSNAFRRCVSYLAKMEPSIEGANGSARAIAAACVIARFGLEGNEARQAFETFNQRCQPPWSDREVEHKLADGRAKVVADGTFGSKARVQPREGGETESAPSDDYYGEPPEDLHGEDPVRSHLPEVVLPGHAQTISGTGATLGKLLDSTGRIFMRGGVPTRLFRDDEEINLAVLHPAAASSVFESVARLFEWKVSEKRAPHLKPAICKEHIAKQILMAEPFCNELPPIRVVSHCPVITERDGQPLIITGYDRESGIWAQGELPEEPPLVEAVQLLDELLAEYHFETPNDHSRALAALVTPALVLGGLLKGRAPIDLGEADDSQAGKGYRNKLTAAIYRQSIKTVTQRAGGVGSLQEAFDAKLISGASFISLDNIRGKVDLPGLESFLTEPNYSARIPYSGQIEIETSRINVMMTTNRADLTIDLANRSSIVRIRKAPKGTVFRRFPEGGLLEHVIANQPRYLGAVFAVVREWFNQGKPTVEAMGHDFRPWAACLGWIVEHLFQAAPLLDGHREVQQRVSSEATNWLRDVFLMLKRRGKLEVALRPGALLQLIVEERVEVPGMNLGIDLEDKESYAQGTRRLGLKLTGLLKGETSQVIDGILVERCTTFDKAQREKAAYRLSDANPPKFEHSPKSPPKQNPSSPSSPSSSKSIYAGARACVESFPTLGELGGDLGGSCDHLNPEAWVHRDGMAYCPICDRFMGRVPSKAPPDLSRGSNQPINGAHVH